jgi:DNA-binding NarL/FixJ family response regulator
LRSIIPLARDKAIKKENSSERTLDTHFKNNQDLPSRNSAIIEALKDGYTQGEVARYLDVSAALVSYVFRSFND